ncbi:FAD binding domain-containing protein [Desulfoferula mesophila]|uniref:FAD binding domain-containing protein n=1 Tax=Desulfoferula mesophila TaxID=3058419 RepID=UPI0030CED842
MEPFEYIAPSSLAEAISLLADPVKNAKLLAGGTDLMVQMKRGHAQPAYLIDLKEIPGLGEIVFQPDHVIRLGALVTAGEIVASPEVAQHLPVLAETAGVIGSVQIRNRATIGGNLCRAAPSGDFAPILMALGASLALAGPEGERFIPVEELFLAPGKTSLRPGELLTQILVPVLPANAGAVYQRFSYRETLDLALVGAAVFLRLDPSSKTCLMARIALASVAPVPLRAHAAEAMLSGKAPSQELLGDCALAAASEAAPIDDVYGTAWYKKQVLEAMVRRGLAKALKDCE